MAPFIETERTSVVGAPDNPAIRVLCLGNDILADDALGILVAKELRRTLPESVDVVSTIESGFALMDYVEDADQLVVVDTVTTGRGAPGTVYQVREDDLRDVYGSSPHYVGLFEGLALGRRLGLRVPHDVAIVAVEGADCRTVGGRMSSAVAAAMPEVVTIVERTIGGFRDRPATR
jgi:hydrogenase maturation protease